MSACHRLHCSRARAPCPVVSLPPRRRSSGRSPQFHRALPLLAYVSLGSVTAGAVYLSSALIPAAPLVIRAGFIGAIMLLPSARQYSHITSRRNVAIDKGGVRLTQTWNTTDAAANAVGVPTSWITTYLVRDGECNAFTCEIGLCKE